MYFGLVTSERLCGVGEKGKFGKDETHLFGKMLSYFPQEARLVRLVQTTQVFRICHRDTIDKK